MTKDPHLNTFVRPGYCDESRSTASAVSCPLPLAMAEEARIPFLTGCLIFSLGGHTSTCTHSYPAPLCYPYLFYQQPRPPFSLDFQVLLL